MPSNVFAYLADGLANVPFHWQRLTIWYRAKKRAWLYTKPMKVVSPLGITYPLLEAFYGYSWAIFLINTFFPCMLLLSWYVLGLACTWQPSRQYVLQDLCFVPGFQQPNASSWPIDRFHQTNGSEQGAAKYLESVMVGPTALVDHTIAVHQQRMKIEKSPYAQRSRLPENLLAIEQVLQEFNPKFEQFSQSLCLALDNIDHGFWTFVQAFDSYTASMDDYNPYMSWSSLAFYPWSHVARVVNAEFNTTYLPKYRLYSWRIEAEVIYEFDRFFQRSMNALEEIDRGFLARDLPAFLENMAPLLQTYTLLLASDSDQIDWLRNEAFESYPLHQQLAQRYLGFSPQALDTLDKYRALYDRNGKRLAHIEAALHKWSTYIAQLRSQMLSLRHSFQRRNTVVDLLFQKKDRPSGSVVALMQELKDLGREKHVQTAAGRYTNVMHFNMQIGRLHDMIVGVRTGSGPEGEWSCVAEMHRARQAYQKEIGIDAGTVIDKLLKAHRDHQKGQPMPEYW